MATFLIRSAGVSQDGTEQADQFIVASGARRATLQGLGGNDQFDFQDFNSASDYGDGFANGNEGDDTFDILVNSGVGIAGSFFGGGQGKDSINIAFRSAEFFIGNTLQGGDGNDSIIFTAGTSDRFNNVTINGNAGNDVIDFNTGMIVSGGRVTNVFIGGGQGTDLMNVRFSSDATSFIDGLTVAGGQGIDIISFQLDNDTASNVVINGGTLNTDDAEDLGDNIFASAENFLDSTIVGNRGDDVITVDADATSERVLIAGNAGADTLIVTAMSAFDAVTLGGGRGDDLLVANSAVSYSAGRNTILGGEGDDTVLLQDGTGFSAGDGVTMEGGAGADLFIDVSAFRSAATTGGQGIEGGNFRFASLSDSTFGESDTINMGTADSARFALIMPDDVQVFNGRLADSDFFFTGGILEQSGDFTTGNNLNLSQIVAVLDANLATGDAVGFRITTSINTGDQGFVFVKGGTDDLLVTFNAETGFSAGNATLANSAPDVIQLNTNP